MNTEANGLKLEALISNENNNNIIWNNLYNYCCSYTDVCYHNIIYVYTVNR